MSQFLWVEDFEESHSVKPYTDFVFGELLQDIDSKQRPTNKEEMRLLLEKRGVFLELTFADGLEFIYDDENLRKVDYIILDVRLAIEESADEDYKHLSDILKYYEKEEEPRTELKMVAGYQLYIELIINLGFPKEHILLCSNHANHLQSLADAFDKARMRLPKIPTKEETDKAYVRKWVKEQHENPYSVLRRGIINGCQYIQSLLKDQQEAVIQFGEFFKTDNHSQPISVPDMLDYLESLQNILPLREPKHPLRLYKLFVRSLAHEWDAAKPHLLGRNQDGQLQAFGWIMKNVRNWAAHKNLFENLTEKEVVFLFLINMRTMFQLENAETKPFEKALLSLFSHPLSQDEMSALINNKSLNLAKSYSSLKRKVQNDKDDAVTFVGMLNNLVNRDKISQGEISHRLFQMFWHGLSRAKVNNVTTSTGRQGGIENAGIWYTFQIHDYGVAHPNSFIFQLARHIYSESQLGR